MLQLQVTDAQGWTKTYPPVLKEMSFIGSGAADDVRLDAVRDGTLIQARHAQFIELSLPTTTGQRQYRLINMSEEPIRVTPAVSQDDQLVQRLGSVIVVAGDRLNIGPYTLTVLDGEATASATANGPVSVGGRRVVSAVIGLEMRLPYTVLSPDTQLKGGFIVRNNGERNAAQFDIEVAIDGRANDACQHLFSVTMYPGVSQDIPLILTHPCGPALRAGDHDLSVCVTAPDFYVGEMALETRKLHVLPCHRHQLQRLERS